MIDKFVFLVTQNVRFVKGDCYSHRDCNKGEGEVTGLPQGVSTYIETEMGAHVFPRSYYSHGLQQQGLQSGGECLPQGVTTHIGATTAGRIDLPQGVITYTGGATAGGWFFPGGYYSRSGFNSRGDRSALGGYYSHRGCNVGQVLPRGLLLTQGVRQQGDRLLVVLSCRDSDIGACLDTVHRCHRVP